MSKKQIANKSRSRHRNRSKLQPKSALGHYFLLSMFLLGSLAGGFQATSHGSLPSVLAYATSVSHGGLLASTNQQRTSNGLGSLTLNTMLNAAAQAKAEDMVAKDYWAHTSPDGRQPWSFILATGYSYSIAGENLAYGALTSESAVQAWMHSPGHRANILKPEFREVGFGYANASNYQGSGPQTVIVAMYTAPYSAPATTAPVKPKPKPPKPTTAVKSDNQLQRSSQPATSVVKKPEQPAKPAPKPKPVEKVAESSRSDEQATQVEKDGEETVAPVTNTQPVKRVSIVTGNYSGWAVVFVLLVGVLAGGLSLYRHSQAWQRRIRHGDQFIVSHPLVDAVAMIAIAIVVVMVQNVGHIL